MNHAGIIDLVPAEVRQQWTNDGIYPDKSLFDLFCEHARKILKNRLWSRWTTP